MNQPIERSGVPLNSPLGESFPFDHVGVSVSNLERSHQFYSEVLGFRTLEESFTLPAHHIRGLILLNGHGVRIELFERQGSVPHRAAHPTEGTLVHGWFQLALAVTHIDATFDRAVANGAKPVMRPRVAPDGLSRVAFIGDPDGNLIEFLQRQPKPAG